MGVIGFQLLFFLCSFSIAALCSSFETIISSLRLFELNELEAKVGRFPTLFSTWRNKPQRLLVVILIVNCLADVISSVLATEISTALFGNDIGTAIGVLTATMLIVLFGNIIPKSLARVNKGSVPIIALGFIEKILFLLGPLVTLCLWSADRVSYLIRGKTLSEDDEHAVSEKELQFLIGYSDEKGIIESEKTELLQNVFGLGLTEVGSIMVPKRLMVALDVNTDIHAAKQLFANSRYSRIPLYDSDPDNIVGFMYQKDLLTFKEDTKVHNLTEIMRPVVFIPETKKVNQLLREFLKTRRHIAIIVDEYGAVVGLVTLEDVLEEIVGEIRDEHEEVEADIVALENGQYRIAGVIELKKIETLLSLTLPASKSVTLGGFLTERLQKIPEEGDSFFYKGFCFVIERVAHRTVQHVLIMPQKEEE